MMWDVSRPPTLRCKIRHHTATVTTALFVAGPHGLLATAGMDKRVVLWDCTLTEGVQEEPEVGRHHNVLFCPCFVLLSSSSRWC